ncbi:MAG: hypothetical protein JWL87_56 [Candidatus Adlerbacteria bacterium]|nr:hypothetical protein [Candidatus Adlerbacteria bacterium]
MVATVSTFTWKSAHYGQTPFFNWLVLMVEERTVAAAFNGWHSLGDLSALLAPKKTQAQLARAVPVLAYHRLTLTEEAGQLPVARFMDQMETLHRAGWHTATLEEYRQFVQGTRTLPERTFLLTFDDGAQQSYYPVDPILKTLGYSAVQYVIVSASETPKSIYYLSPEQISAMLSTGRWEIGSHSFDAHHTYPTDPAGGTGIFYTDKLWMPTQGRLETDAEFLARVHDDLLRARQALEARYGVTVDTFAVPFGGETGHRAADNYAGGSDITLAEARRLYDFVWLQTDRRDFTFNYPSYPSILGRRIHVDYDWEGETLKTFMEGGVPKALPYRDNFAVDSGWRHSWGSVQPIGSLELGAGPQDTSAGSVLDGSLLWSAYQAEATVNWEHGYAVIMGAVRDAHTYRSCSFSPGEVEIHDTSGTSIIPLAKRAESEIQYGQGVKLGIRVEDAAISCLYNGHVLLSAPTGRNEGGVGIQTWAPEPGTASLLVTNFLADPL